MRECRLDRSNFSQEAQGAWDQLLQSADTKTVEFLKRKNEGARVPPTASFWKRVKDFLLEHVVGGKCVYCEKVLEDQDATADHYRPKGGVDGVTEHEGYYWLVFEVSNFVPACLRCNRAKQHRFPLPVEDLRARGPEDGRHAEELNKKEKPLVLNPLFDTQLGAHLRFLKDGSVEAVSARGESTIRALKLCRKTLAEARREAISKATNKVHGALTTAHLADTDDEARKKVRMHLMRVLPKIVGPEAPFSRAVRDYLLTSECYAGQQVHLVGLDLDEFFRAALNGGAGGDAGSGDGSGSASASEM